MIRPVLLAIWWNLVNCWAWWENQPNFGCNKLSLGEIEGWFRSVSVCAVIGSHLKILFSSVLLPAPIWSQETSNTKISLRLGGWRWKRKGGGGGGGEAKQEFFFEPFVRIFPHLVCSPLRDLLALRYISFAISNGLLWSLGVESYLRLLQ